MFPYQKEKQLLLGWSIYSPFFECQLIALYFYIKKLKFWKERGEFVFIYVLKYVRLWTLHNNTLVNDQVHTQFYTWLTIYTAVGSAEYSQYSAK